jgi:hypothetical protein
MDTDAYIRALRNRGGTMTNKYRKERMHKIHNTLYFDINKNGFL